MEMTVRCMMVEEVNRTSNAYQAWQSSAGSFRFPPEEKKQKNRFIGIILKSGCDVKIRELQATNRLSRIQY